MNAPSRRQRIEAMLADDPRDTFLRYSLAMEMRKDLESESSLAILKELTQQEPAYVPAFLMAAQQLVDLARIPEARGILRLGIEAARGQRDLHAAAEMSELLGQLGSMGE